MLGRMSFAAGTILVLATAARNASDAVKPVQFICLGLAAALFFTSGRLATHRKSLNIAVSLFFISLTLIVVSAALANGNLAAPVTSIVTLFPVIGFCFAGRRFGLIATGWAVTIIIGLLSAEFFGVTKSEILIGNFARTKAVVLVSLCILSAFIGVTFHLARKTSEARLIEASRLASLGTMAAGIAHEINNPLMIIQGWADHIELSTRTGQINREQLKKCVETIGSTVSRIAAIVAGLRIYSRDDSGLDPNTVSIRDIVDSTLALCKERFRASGIDLLVEDYAPNVEVKVRRVQISQVLLNLLSNAFDAVERCAVKRVTITIALSRGDCVIAVIDTGAGVPVELRRKIFSPFFTTKEVGKGTGLGLSISASIAQAHGGTLELSKSSPTAFELRLPLASHA